MSLEINETLKERAIRVLEEAIKDIRKGNFYLDEFSEQTEVYSKYLIGNMPEILIRTKRIVLKRLEYIE